LAVIEKHGANNHKPRNDNVRGLNYESGTDKLCAAGGSERKRDNNAARGKGQTGKVK
jgi:hypothetical protein